MSRAPALVLVASLSVSCGGAADRAARAGDLPTLRAAIATRHAEGSISNHDAREIGTLLLQHDLEAAHPVDARALLGDAAACAVDIDDALAVRARKNDELAPVAAMMRIESGKLDLSTAHRFKDDYLKSDDERWRALGARTLVDASDAEARRHAMVDVSPFVRRAAFRASREAHDTGDEAVLLESARLDPEPMARTEALRALVELGVRPQDATRPTSLVKSVSKLLGDLYISGDDGIREDVASAWARTPFYEHGGRAALRTMFATNHGPGVIAGAGALLRHHASEDDEDSDSRDALEEKLARTEAENVLLKTLEVGSERDKLHALATAPGDVGARLAKKAESDTSFMVRVAAFSRGMTDGTRTKEVEARLIEIARDPDRPVVADRAKLALAQAKVISIQSWLEADLAAPSPERRISAAQSLAVLGRAARAAPLFTDADAHVRHRVACIVVRGDI